MNYYIILDDCFVFESYDLAYDYVWNNITSKQVLCDDVERWEEFTSVYTDENTYEVALMNSELYDYYYNDIYKIMFDFEYAGEEYVKS